MKLKKALATVLVLTMLLSLAPAALAAGTEAEDAADALYALGLFQGAGTDSDGAPVFELGRAMTRSEAVTMLVRLLGRENEALSGKWETPFTDVPAWAEPYVGLAYENGLTTGTGDTTFSSGERVTSAQYLTFILRALGYDDAAGDFDWESAWELTDELGVTSGEYGAANNGAFVRGDAALVSLSALSQELKGSDTTLLEKISAQDPPSADLGSVMEDASAEHKQLFESGEVFNGFTDYIVNDPETTDLLSAEEIAALVETGRGGNGSISREQAEADVDLFFRAVEAAYGAYYYFGAENFDAARAEVMAWLDGRSAVRSSELEQKLSGTLDFVRDAHFQAGDDRVREELFRYEYFYCPDQSWAQDDVGYYKYIGGEKWYFSSFSDSRVRMEPSLTRAGELCWAPVLFCRPADMTESTVTLKNAAGETRSERLTWTESEPYSESMRVPDYNLLRENGIVYISERNFDLSYKELLDGFAADAAKVRDAKLIIFDIRANGGGADEFGRSWVENFCGQQPETTAAWSTRVSALRNAAGVRDGFAPEEGTSGFYYHVANLEGRQLPNDIPIIVLVDDMCGSSGESMLNFLRELDNVLVVGSNSSGYQICGNVMSFRLPRSGIYFSFGASFGLSFTTENVDFKGYEPDVWCDPAHALDAALNLILRYGLADLDTWQAFRSAVYAVT